MDKNKKVQFIVIAGLGLTIVSLFLKIYRASLMGETYSDSIFHSYSSQGKTGAVFLYLVCPILATLFVLLKKRIPVIIFGLLQCGLWILLTSTFKDEFSRYQVDFSFGPGYYLGLLGAVVIVVGGIMAIATKAFKKEN